MASLKSGDKTSEYQAGLQAGSQSRYQVGYEKTPNPAVYRFPVNKKISDKNYEFRSIDESEESPLAQKLFGFPWCQSLFIGSDFVAITKQDWVGWDVLAEPLAGLIREHLEAGEPAVTDQITIKGRLGSSANKPIDKRADKRTDKAVAKPKAPLSDKEKQIELEIQSILDKDIRPFVARDGGDVEYHSYQNNIVYLYMRGACSGCPSSKMTLKVGIEARLKERIPEIKEVIAI